MTTTETTLTERIAFLHTMGLDSRYDDVLGFEDIGGDLAEQDREAFLAAGPAFDYQTQAWMDHADHAHIVTNDSGAPLVFCGSDITTCVGIAR